MIQIEQLFPTHIGYAINPFHKEIEDELTQQCLKIKRSYKKDFEEFRKENINSASPILDWFQFQRSAPYELLKDQKFNRLHSWIDEQIKEYTEKLVLVVKLKCISGWFNVYEKYEFADYHNHLPNIVSCVYFLNCEEGAGANLLFKNPSKDTLISYCKGMCGELVQDNIFHTPFPGKLVVFASDIEHAVQQHNTNNSRITLSYNYREG